MFELFGQLQFGVWLVLGLGALALKGFAFFDAVRVPAQSYPAAGKWSKKIWLAILGVALAVNIVVIEPLNFINLIGVVAAGVYLVDVRPAVRQIGRGGSRSGPYGSW